MDPDTNLELDTRGAQRTEADAVADIALTMAEPEVMDPEKVYGAPHEIQIADLERYLANPRRLHESITLHTPAALGAFVAAFKVDGTALYADLEARTIVGVLNGSVKGQAGWNDHRASLELRHTPDWKHWASKDGQLTGQVAFAEHIEEGLDAIVDPPAADMLELAQSFEAKQSVQFRQANRLQDGQRQLVYDEAIDAKAGTKGSIDIPEFFTLGLAPFEGCDPYKIQARLRYRISEGRLTIGYKLVRPDEVLRATFDDIVATVEKATGLTAFGGKPPVR